MYPEYYHLSPAQNHQYTKKIIGISNEVVRMSDGNHRKRSQRKNQNQKVSILKGLEATWMDT